MFKCKICGKKYTELTALYNHIESKHNDMIPQDMSVQQYYYYMKTGKMNGNCVMCKQPTSWNSNTGKYNRFCGNPKCKDEYVKIMKSRMVAKYGKTHLLNDPNKQREMLANRSISGVYEWSDGKHETTYTGSYELDFLKTLDHFFEWDPEDISMPSPHTYTYKYEGEDKFYIPDVFIHSLDLEIEIKDGGDNPNNHYKIQAVDKHKEALKDEVLCSQKMFHYIKITNKNYENFFQFLKEAKKEFEKYGDEKKIPRIFKIEDIKGTSTVIKESSDNIIDVAVKKFNDWNDKPYREHDMFLSLKYDLVKNDPKELQNFLSSLIKAARFKDDVVYIEKIVKCTDDHYKKLMRKHPDSKDRYNEYYEWVKKGMQGEIKDRKKEYDLRESYEHIEENLIFSKDHIEFNLDKFGKSENVLYITGLGGSGKSTIIKEYAANYKAEALEFDAVTSALIKGLDNLNRNKIHPIIIEYLETQNPDKLTGFEDPKFVSESVKFLDWFEAKVSGDDKLYILEGMQLFICFEPERFTGRPMVVMGTSVVKSMYRSNLRVYKRSEGDIIKTFKFFLKTLQRINIFIKNDKQINNLINALNESLELIEEKFEPDKFLVWFDKPIQKLKGGKIKLYHGTLERRKGNTFVPFSINVGATKYSDPRWSTYFWDNREDAMLWSSARAVMDIVGVENMLYIGHNEDGKVIVKRPKGMTDKEFANYLIEKSGEFYIYEVEVDIKDLEVGARPIIREYTVSKPVDIIKEYKYKLNKEIIRRCVRMVDEVQFKDYDEKYGVLNNTDSKRGSVLNAILDPHRNSYRPILLSELRNGNVRPGDDISDFRYSINRHLKANTYNFESYIIDTMKESSISIPQMNYYLQNEYEEEMKKYLNTYKKYYNLMLKEQPSAVKHINEDIRKCLIVIDGLAEKGVENNLVQFAKDDLGEIVKAAKHGKPVRVFEGTNTVNLKIVYDNPNSKQVFSLSDMSSKIIVEEDYIIQRDKVGTHCSVTPYYNEIDRINEVSFKVELPDYIEIENILNNLIEGIIIANLFKFEDQEFKFIKEASLKLFGSYPTKIRKNKPMTTTEIADDLEQRFIKIKEKHNNATYNIDEFLVEPREYFIQFFGNKGELCYKKSFKVSEHPNLDKELIKRLKKHGKQWRYDI